MKVLFLVLFLLIGCSSTPPVSQLTVPNAGEEKVLSRIDDLSSRPKYITESTPFKVEGGKVYSLGQTVIPIGDNISAAFRIAENNAKALVSGAIENRLDFVFENAEEGTAMGASPYLEREFRGQICHGIHVFLYQQRFELSHDEYMAAYEN